MFAVSKKHYEINEALFFRPTVETNTNFFRGETIEVTVVSFDKFILLLQFV